MKKTLFILFCISIQFLALGQNSAKSESFGDTIFFNEKWKETNKEKSAYYRILKQIDSKFAIEDHRMNGTLFEKAEYSSITPYVKDGCSMEYYPNDSLKCKGNYVKNMLQGKFWSYGSDGVLISEEIYKDNLLHGLSTYYTNGIDSGYVERVYEQGVLLSTNNKNVFKKQKKVEKETHAEVFMPLEVNPEYPGGDKARMEFLSKNLHYPIKARAANIEGTVYVEFTIEIDGSVSNPIIKRDIGAGCGDEALRIVKLMPKWEPGMQKGMPVKTNFVMPIKFILK
jgi:TonB family protein